VREEGAGHAVVPYYETPARPPCLDAVMDMDFTTKSVVQPGKKPEKGKGKKTNKKQKAEKPVKLQRASFKRPPPGRTEVKKFTKERPLSSSWDDILLAGLPVAAYPQSESRGAKVYSVQSKSGIQHSNTS
jgi:hypothetical protein